MPTPTRVYGAHPSPRDPQDFHVAAATVQHALVLPAVFSLRNDPAMPPITDQGQEGCCVGHALKALMRFLAARAGKVRDIASRDIYEEARQEQPVNGEGCIPKAALDAGRKLGYCLEADRPYLAQHPTAPGPLAAQHRPQNMVASYAFVPPDVTSVKVQMTASKTPILMQIAAVEGFETPDAHGVVTHQGRSLGGHELLIVGYDDTRQAWEVRNSWGTGWGLGGYCWLPYTYPLVEAQVVKATFTDARPRPWWRFW